MIPTDKLKISGKEYPFHFGMGAMRLFAIKTDNSDVKINDLGDLIGKASISDLDTLMWCGLKSGAAKEGIAEFDLQLDDINETFNENPAIFDRAMALLNEMQNAVEESEEVANKELGN